MTTVATSRMGSRRSTRLLDELVAQVAVLDQDAQQADEEQERGHHREEGEVGQRAGQHAAAAAVVGAHDVRDPAHQRLAQHASLQRLETRPPTQHGTDPWRRSAACRRRTASVAHSVEVLEEPRLQLVGA